LGIAAYGIYTTIISSYYWFSLGRNITTVSATIYVIVDLAIHWDQFIYTRHIPKMIFDRMNTELTEAPTPTETADETQLREYRQLDTTVIDW